MRLLIVDDNPGARTSIRSLIAAPDDAVRECGSAAEATRVAAEFNPDCVALGAGIPERHRLETTRELRRGHPGIRIIIVAGDDNPESRKAARDAGADGFVSRDGLAESNRGVPGAKSRMPSSGATARAADVPVDLRSPMAQLKARVEELEWFPAFLANQLRGPLQAISKNASVLQVRQSDLPAAQAQACARSIAETSDRLRRQMDGLLALVEGDHSPAQSKAVATSRLVRDCWTEACPPERRERVAFEVDPLPDVQGDPELLSVLFTNLLGNAVKFSASSGSPHIRVNGCTSGSHVVFAVADNGVGFNLQHAGKLFMPLSRLHSAEEFPGLGLGLALARRIVQQHGGRIWADAAVGQGATFYFTLPRLVTTGPEDSKTA